MVSVNLMRLPQTNRVQYPYSAYSQLETKSDRRKNRVNTAINTAFNAANMFLRQKNLDRDYELRKQQAEQTQAAAEQEQANRQATANYMRQGGPDPTGGMMGGPGFSSEGIAQNNMANQGVTPPMTGTPDPKVVQEMKLGQLKNYAYATTLIATSAEGCDTYECFAEKTQVLTKPNPVTKKPMVNPAKLAEITKDNFEQMKPQLIMEAKAALAQINEKYKSLKPEEKKETPQEKSDREFADFQREHDYKRKNPLKGEGEETLSWEEKKKRTEEDKREHELWKRSLPQTPAQQKNTQKEREAEKLRAGLPRLQEIAKENPMEVYRNGYQMNDNGTVYTDLITGTPRKLPDPHKVIGKRGGPTALKQAAEHWDDAKEVMALLKDPEVQTVLNRADGEGLFNRAKSRWYNELTKWLQEHKYGKDSKAYQAVVRIQKMASDDRKKYLGVAVTEAEMQTVRGWLIDTGDTFSEIMAKAKVIESEGEEHFLNWLGVFKNQANMSDWYDTFGVKRFKGSESSASEKAKALIEKYRTGTQ